MRALRLVGASEFVYGEVEAPGAGEGEVVVRVRACGICGSDVHGMDGSSGRRIPPVIMGHEAAGEIVEIGTGVEGWTVGDRVTMDSTLYCGECSRCMAGEINLCPERRVLGVSCVDFRQDGAFAERVVVPARVLHRLPEGLSYAEAAFAEPVAVALHAVSRGGVRPGDRAVVVGSGLIGLLVVQALVRAGCREVIAVDRDGERLALACELGAAAGYLPDDPALRSAVGADGKDGGVEVVFEVVGIGETLALAVGLARRGGRVVCVGNLRAEVPLPLQAVVTREITLAGSCASAGEYPEALEAIGEGSIRVVPLTSVRAPLAEGAEWFARQVVPGNGLFKVILEP